MCVCGCVCVPRIDCHTVGLILPKFCMGPSFSMGAVIGRGQILYWGAQKGCPFYAQN